MQPILQILLSTLLAITAYATRPNVLLIVADDLRCDLAAYGHAEAITPNLDRLAARSRVFTRAYCQQAVCNPSRASMMTGLRPDHTRITDLRTHFRETIPDVTTLSQHFKNHGYQAVGIGKIYHNYHQSIQGDPASWSLPQRFHWGNHRMDQAQIPDTSPLPFDRLQATQELAVADDAYIDGRIANATVEAMKTLKNKSFFLAAGFWKPHLPYNAPKKYWDLYDRKKLTPPDHAGRPQGAPALAIHNSPEPRGYHGIPSTGEISRETVMQLRHGYLAAISYLDANIGKLLDGLEQHGLADNTIIVFWSDNGYHLGENEMLGKLTNFERDTRVPLMISIPKLKQAGKSESIVEILDIYPTLTELCELPPPAHVLDGTSLAPVLENPSTPVKQAAISQHPNSLTHPTHMGYSVRDPQFRYTEWRSLTDGKVTARELYYYENRLIETRNLATDADRTAQISTLAAKLPPARKISIPRPPGIIIHHSPAASGRYIGSPSICILPDGSYLASHDLFGPKSKEHVRATGRLYHSADRGLTWQHRTDFDGFFWQGLFTHKNAVYTLGNDKHHGNVVIRRSTDKGLTWTPPAIIAKGQFHGAPVPVIEHAGRLWRAMEDAHTSTKWGERYRARMMSAPADADLLDPKSWTLSNPIARQTEWLDGGFRAWLEGNAVVDPKGNLVNILRVDHPNLPEMAAIVHLSNDGKTASFDPQKDIIKLPGGSKKFTIRKDPSGPGYWTLASIIPERYAHRGEPASIRNTLALLHSKNLIDWQIRRVLLQHPDTVKHGFQYVDWQFEGSDIIAACRTAWDDDQGGARNNHDANFLTFHRWENFRKLNQGAPR